MSWFSTKVTDRRGRCDARRRERLSGRRLFPLPRTEKPAALSLFFCLRISHQSDEAVQPPSAVQNSKVLSLDGALQVVVQRKVKGREGAVSFVDVVKQRVLVALPVLPNRKGTVQRLDEGALCRQPARGPGGARRKRIYQRTVADTLGIYLPGTAARSRPPCRCAEQ